MAVSSCVILFYQGNTNQHYFKFSLDVTTQSGGPNQQIIDFCLLIFQEIAMQQVGKICLNDIELTSSLMYVLCCYCVLKAPRNLTSPEITYIDILHLFDRPPPTPLFCLYMFELFMFFIICFTNTKVKAMFYCNTKFAKKYLFLLLHISYYVLFTLNFGQQRRIQNQVENLRWIFFAKIVNGFQPLTIIIKKLHRSCWTGF